MMIPQNKSVASPQEFVGNKTKNPPTILWSKVRQRIPEENGVNIPLTLL